MGLSRRKALALLAYLAVTRRLHTREALATLLWPDYEPSSAYAYLRNALWVLNQTPLAGWLDTEDDAVGLKEGLWVDVVRFQALRAGCQAHDHPPPELCADCAARLSEAADLYQGDFMAGFTLGDSAAFDDWQFLETEHLRHAFTDALEKLTDYHGRCGELETALAYGMRWVAVDPLHEPAHCCLMALYARSGQRAAALRQYETLTRALQAEGLEPESDTVELYQQIRTGALERKADARPVAPPTAPALAHNLPAQATAFVGRGAELADLRRLLATPGCRLITLTGLGGMGKTRLALRAAEEQIGAFAHGVFFVPLAAVSAPQFVVPAIAEAMGTWFLPQSSVSPQQQLLNYLAEREMLLVLDNLEHLLERTDLIADLLLHAPRIKLLVTSRQRLNLRGEWVMELQGLTHPQEGDLAHAFEYDAVQLFVESARRAMAGYVLREDALEAIARISSLLEGHPLGIELAAAWTKMLSCAEIAAEIAASLDFLALSPRDAPERHSSLRAAFARSWELLSNEERAAFLSLSVFLGGFTREAAMRVAGAGLQILSALVDKSLIRRVAEGRYEILGILRQYAQEQLAESPGEDRAVRERHCAYYLGLLRQMELPLKGGAREGADLGQQAALEAIRGDLDNVRAAWRWAVARARFDALAAAAIPLALYYDIRSRFREGEQAFREAAAALSAQGDESRAALLGLLLGIQGEFLGRLAQANQSRTVLARATSLLSPLEVPAERALVWILGAYGFTELTMPERLGQLEESLRLYRTLGDPWGMALAMEVIGEAYCHGGEYDAAQPYLQDSLDLRREIGDQWGTAMSLFSLGVSAEGRGRWSEAKAYYDGSLALREELGDTRGAALCRQQAARVMRALGDPTTAQQLLRVSLRAFTDVGDLAGAGGTLWSLADIAWESGDLEEARSLFTASLQEFRAADLGVAAAGVLRRLGDLALRTGCAAEAQACFQESLGIAERLDDEPLAADAREGLARAREALGLS